jgi:predicted  nucleic acid-binding Zn-ribbon protein
MKEHGLHRELEVRLEALAQRIAALRRRMSRAKGVEKIEQFGEIEELERRQKKLAERLRALDREGPGFRQDVKADLERMADDLSGTVEEFMLWADSHYRGRRPSIRGPKP